MHAALGEPARLAIVDLLGFGDASPSELSQQLGMPTNLLAHHLNVLSDARLVFRARSEGDKRRSYVRLRLSDPLIRAAVTPRPFGPVPRVLFVCTRNSARSQLALAYWTKISAVPALSAGTHPAPRISPKALAAGRRFGLRMTDTGTRQVDAVRRRNDLIVAVCDSAHEELEPTIPRLHWSIADPARIDTDDAFDAALVAITQRADVLADAVGLVAPSG
jgi:protein-tyrosine-phosphatase